MRSTRSHRLHPRGFTLIELIATMAVVGALGSIAASILIASIGGLMEATTSAQLHTELSIALDRVDRELRNVASDSGASDIAPDIDALTSTSITWNTSDQLSLAGSQLNLTLGGTSAVLLDDVTALSVKAYDEDNTQMSSSLSGAACDDIRRLLIDITVSREGVTERLRTKIFLRCTMAGG
jgi:prepilin-type N-terminal cleavage/methylation domain-containing protein